MLNIKVSKRLYNKASHNKSTNPSEPQIDGDLTKLYYNSNKNKFLEISKVNAVRRGYERRSSLQDNYRKKHKWIPLLRTGNIEIQSNQFNQDSCFPETIPSFVVTPQNQLIEADGFWLAMSVIQNQESCSLKRPNTVMGNREKTKEDEVYKSNNSLKKEGDWMVNKNISNSILKRRKTSNKYSGIY